MKFSLGKGGFNVETEARDLDIARAAADCLESGMQLAEALELIDAEDGQVQPCEKCGDDAVTRKYPVFKGEGNHPELADLCRGCQEPLAEKDIADYRAGRAQQELEDMEDGDG